MLSPAWLIDIPFQTIKQFLLRMKFQSFGRFES